MQSWRSAVSTLALVTVIACGGGGEVVTSSEAAADEPSPPAATPAATEVEPRAWMQVSGAREDRFEPMSMMVQPLRGGGGISAEETGTGLSIVLRAEGGGMLNLQHVPLEPSVGTFPLITQQLGEDAGKVEVIVMLPKKNEDVPIPNVPYGLQVSGELEVTDVTDGRLSATFTFEAFSMPDDEATKIKVEGGFEALELPD